MKNKNQYDEVIEAILSLPGDVRGDVLRIASRFNPSHPFLYLFERVMKNEASDPLNEILMEQGTMPKVQSI